MTLKTVSLGYTAAAAEPVQETPAGNSTLKTVSLGYTAAAAEPVQETPAGNSCSSRAQTDGIRKNKIILH
jgi:hypothetical protein